MHLSIFSFKRLLRERILLLLPFLAAGVLGMHAIAPPSDAYRVIENNSFWKKKTFDKKKYNIVVGGDSRVYRGVSPQAMNEVLPRISIINFAYGSAGYDEIMLKQIDKRINYEDTVRMVVLGVTPVTLTKLGCLNYHLNYELNTKREELIDLLYFKKIFQFFIPFTPDQLYRAIKGKKFVTTRHQEYMEGGWVATHEDKPWSEAALKSYRTLFVDNQVLPENVQRLADQVRRWTEKGVTVVVFRPPTTQKMVALEDSLSGYHEAEIKKTLTAAGAVWLDFINEDYTTFDGSHLQKEGAIRFSKDLAEKIKKIQASRSPAYKEP